MMRVMRARQVEHHEALRVAPPRASRMREAAMMCGWFALLLGCGPDPGGKFNEFIKDTRESTSGTSSRSASSPLPSMSWQPQPGPPASSPH